MTLIWEDPPPPCRAYSVERGADWAAIAAALVEHPGRWARVTTYPSQAQSTQAAHRIRHGEITAFAERGEFGAVSRTVDGEYRVYARHVGDA